ncbi:hypothetical protein CDAR_57601 [Caerostris darwini]|uniref:Uncharacterized protein n=1 Tax=Caerostris darwini TaxID=1538125 RepID=A0AAV4SXZ3_9ARAC|nr:hypothetical protein CDAR_57601 [Caerostris darwini]
MPAFLLCPGITPDSSGASSVAMETRKTQGVNGTNGMLHEAKVDRRVPKTVHLNKVSPRFRKIMKAGKDFGRMPPFLFCPGITPVCFGALGVAMETQETQGVNGTNGMLHEAKVDRRVPKNRQS